MCVFNFNFQGGNQLLLEIWTRITIVCFGCHRNKYTQLIAQVFFSGVAKAGSGNKEFYIDGFYVRGSPGYQTDSYPLCSKILLLRMQMNLGLREKSKMYWPPFQLCSEPVYITGVWAFMPHVNRSIKCYLLFSFALNSTRVVLYSFSPLFWLHSFIIVEHVKTFTSFGD